LTLDYLLDRRQFIVKLGAATTTITVAGAVVGALAGGRRRREVSAGKRWSADHPLPNAGADVKPAPGTRPEFTPLVRSCIAFSTFSDALLPYRAM
jgi:hypothetical protein